MASQSRKARGMRSQLLVARWLQENGFENAESTGSGRAGVDILGTPGLAIEVKARTGFDPLAWLRQAHEYEQLGLPTVIFRPNGMGEQSVGQWGVLLRLETYTRLVREAGYGSEPTEDQSDGPKDQGTDQDHGPEILGRSLGLPDAIAPLVVVHESNDRPE